MILILFALIYLAGFIIPEDMPILYGISLEVSIIILCFSCFKKTPHERCKEKAGWACITMWATINLLAFTWFSEFSIFNWHVMIFQIILFVVMMFYSQFRSYNFNSDKYDPKGVYIVFKKPKSIFDFIHTCIFRPVSSVSIISNSIWLGYTLGKPYHCEMYNHSKSNWLLRIDLTHDFVIDKLEPLIGSKWGLGNNCCHAVWRLFPSVKFRLTDSLPRSLIEKILKSEEENGQR